MNWLMIAGLILAGLWILISSWITGWVLWGEIRSWWSKRQYEREKARRQL